MRWPLVPVVIGYVLGLLLAEFFQPKLWLLFASAILTALVACCFARFRWALLGVLLVFAGWANLSARTAVLSPHDLRLRSDIEHRLVHVRGVLTQTPSERAWVQNEKESWRFLAQVNASALRTETGEWEPAFGKILVSTPGNLPEGFYAGQEVEIRGLLVSPPGAWAEGLFDYRDYLRRQGVYFLLRAGSTEQWRQIGAVRREPWSDGFVSWAQTTMARGLPGEDLSLRLLWAMVLGWKGGVATQFYEPFIQTGTMHIFAISGLHIVLIAGFLRAFLWIVRVPRPIAECLVIPLLWFYTGATGWQPSAVRATIMTTVILAGYAMRRPSNLLNSLCAAALIILLWDPQQLFGASFQLSFAVVLSLGLIAPRLHAWVYQVKLHDPFLPGVLVPRWRRFLQKPARWLGASAATSLAAWVGAMPLTAHYFHVASPITLLANLVMVPLSGLALAASLGSMLAGPLFPAISSLLNHSAWLCMSIMVGLSRWAATLPWGHFNVSSPPPEFFFAWYGGLLVLALWLGLSLREPAIFGSDLSQMPGGGYPKGSLTVPRVLLLSLALAVGTWRWTGLGIGRPAESITALPMNGGMSLFVQTSGAGAWLVDTGNRSPAERTLAPFLKAQGVDELDGVFLTHGDSLHVGGTMEILDSFQAQEVLVTSVRQRSTVFRRHVAALAEQGIKIRPLSRGDRVGPWKVLHPESGDSFSRADDAALVLSGEFAGISVLLVSDLGYSGQQALLQRGGDLRADILITGLPSVGEPVCDALLDAVQPKAILVCDSEFPAAERIDASVRQRLERRNVPVVCTHVSGVLKLTLRRQGWTLQSSAADAEDPISLQGTKPLSSAVRPGGHRLVRSP